MRAPACVQFADFPLVRLRAAAGVSFRERSPSCTVVKISGPIKLKPCGPRGVTVGGPMLAYFDKGESTTTHYTSVDADAFVMPHGTP